MYNSKITSNISTPLGECIGCQGYCNGCTGTCFGCHTGCTNTCAHACSYGGGAY